MRLKFKRKSILYVVISFWLLFRWPPVWLNPRIPPALKTASAVTDQITSSGTWNAPNGIYTVNIQARGGGAGGSAGPPAGKRPGGGGGGGAFTAGTVNVTPGTGYSVTVGAGVSAQTAGNTSSFPGDASQTVSANGGGTTTDNNGGAGGTAETVTGHITASYAGGQGGTAVSANDNGGGGGGEGGGSTATGGAGQANSGATGGAGGTGTDGGDGGAGGNNTAVGNNGTAPGGGGGGAGGNNNTGGQGARGQVDVIYTDTWAPSTTQATYNNTWSFSSAPTNASSSQINMTAVSGFEYTTPINHLFTLDNSTCGGDAGTGGTSSSWQASSSYSDTGLDPNQCYGYTITTRDSVGTPNTGTASGISTTYTSANTPGTPTLSNPTQTTLDLTNAENSNPSANPTTYFAVQVVTTTPTDSTWENQWVDAAGDPSATAVWHTDSTMDSLQLQGLTAATLYGVQVKARNQDNDETALSAEGQNTTSVTPVYSISITPSGNITYGNIQIGGTMTTLVLGDSRIAVNQGNVSANFSIRSSNATNGTSWTLGGTPGSNIFVHEFSSNSGGNWTTFIDDVTYSTLQNGVSAGASQNFDLRITTPTNSDAVQKDIIITVQTAAP